MKGLYKRKVLTSVLAIAVSIGMICSGTYAWYMGEASNTGNQIQTASYVVTTILSDSGQEQVTGISKNEDTGQEQVTGISKNEDTGIYTVTSAGTYEFVLSATGDSTGYCIITITKSEYEENTEKSEKYCIEQITTTNEDGTKLTVHMDAVGSISFETVWGKFIAEEGTEIRQLSITEGPYIIGTPAD